MEKIKDNYENGDVLQASNVNEIASATNELIDTLEWGNFTEGGNQS